MKFPSNTLETTYIPPPDSVLGSLMQGCLRSALYRTGSVTLWPANSRQTHHQPQFGFLSIQDLNFLLQRFDMCS
eukprot:COSAG02_NODE_6039_length_3853_cov_46.703188_4_plen_73_part_01